MGSPPATHAVKASLTQCGMAGSRRCASARRELAIEAAILAPRTAGPQMKTGPRPPRPGFLRCESAAEAVLLALFVEEVGPDHLEPPAPARGAHAGRGVDHGER